MGIYERYFLPKLLNAAMKSPDIHRIRAAYVPHAHGRVLEIGIGSGLNLPHYQDDVHVTGVDPSAELRVYAEEVAERCGTNVEFLTQGGEEIPADNHVFDSVVVTWTFCTIPEPAQALAEIRRVLKPGGTLVFAEHGTAPDHGVVKWQNRINPLWRKVAGGCNLNRDPIALLTQGGFRIDHMEQDYLPGPKFATYMSRGVAKMA